MTIGFMESGQVMDPCSAPTARVPLRWVSPPRSYRSSSAAGVRRHCKRRRSLLALSEAS